MRPAEPNSSVTKTHVKGSGVSATIIGPGIRQYDSPEAAEMAFQKLATTMKTCRHDTDADGSKLTYFVVNMPETAQGSIEVRVDFDQGTVFNAFALTGTAMVSVGTGGASSSDETLLPSLLTRQAARYRAAASDRSAVCLDGMCLRTAAKTEVLG